MITTTRAKFLHETITAIPGFLNVDRNGASPYGTKFVSGNVGANSRIVTSPGIFPGYFSAIDSIYLISAKMECEVENGIFPCVSTDDNETNYIFKVMVGLSHPLIAPTETNMKALHFKGFEKLTMRHRPLITPQDLPTNLGALQYPSPLSPYFVLEVTPPLTGAQAGKSFRTDLLDSSLLNQVVSYTIVCEWEHSILTIGN